MRFTTTCASRSGSPSMRVSSPVMRRRTLSCAARGSNVLTILCETLARSTFSRRRRKRPPSARASSSRSSTSVTIRSTSCLIRGKNSSSASRSPESSRIVSIMRLIDESGVRNSCETLETNSRRVPSSSCRRVSSLATTRTPRASSNGNVATVRIRAPFARESETRPREGWPASASRIRRSSSNDGTTSMMLRPRTGREPISKIAPAAALSESM